MNKFAYWFAVCQFGKNAPHLKHAVLNTRMGQQYENADATIALSRIDLNKIISKQTSFGTLMES